MTGFPVSVAAPRLASSWACGRELAFLVFPVLALFAAASLLGWYPPAGVTLALTSYGVAARTRSVRWRCAALAVAAPTPLTIALIQSGFQWRTARAGFGIVGPVVLLAQQVRLIGAHRQQTRFAASAARLQERSRIAQEMHDLLGHRLSLISLYAGTLKLDARQPVEATEPLRGAGRRGCGPGRPAGPRAARGAEPPLPTAADCSYSTTYTKDDTMMIERSCFRSDVLVDKTWCTLLAA